MASISVNVRWNGQRHVVQVDPTQPPLIFKTQLFSITNVPPHRQKIMVKGGLLKDDSWGALELKDGHQFMMMGSPEEEMKPVAKKAKQEDEDVKVEAMPVAKEERTLPMGLMNLGNTCYMNATLQCLGIIPELRSSLEAYPAESLGTPSSVDPHHLATHLRDLYRAVSHTSSSLAGLQSLMGEGGGFPPLLVLQALRKRFPQFAQQDNQGRWAQQDAEECWSGILQSLKDVLSIQHAFELKNRKFVERYMMGELITEMKCDENAEEAPSVSMEPFSMLDCHISINTNYMSSGISEGLKTKIQKHSPSLNRDATYTKQSKIARLPAYLTVHFVRFFWKPTERIKAKILRKVKFPIEFDAAEFCTQDLQDKMRAGRVKWKALEDKAIEYRKSHPENLSSLVGKEGSLDDVLHSDLKDDLGCNPTAFYELAAVLTHMGRTGDSGHYIAWTRLDDGGDTSGPVTAASAKGKNAGGSQWVKMDDDKVTPVTEDEILKLDGGGDWHVAYMCLYRKKAVPYVPNDETS